jgi:hypothetical protein
MSTQSLQDLIGSLKDKFGDRMDAIAEGKNPSGAWDGPPMPLNWEYRAEIDSAEYKPSKATGKPQFVVTYVILEPSDFRGRKVQAYYSPTPANEGAQRQFADFVAALRCDLTIGLTTNDYEGFIKQTVGRTAVIALNVWGDENDRYGVRFVNLDRGQVLSTDVKPPRAKTDTKNLRPDIVIPKDAPAPATVPAEAEAPAEVEAPKPATPQLPGGLGATPAKGPNLPPGLK